MEQVYSINDVAKKLGLHRNTVNNMIMRKEIEAHKIGRQWRIKESEIVRLQNGQPRN